MSKNRTRAGTQSTIPILTIDRETARPESGVSCGGSIERTATPPAIGTLDAATEVLNRRAPVADLALFRDMAMESVEQMPLGFVALDHGMCATYANPVALALTGASLDELVGRRPWDLFPEIVGTQHQTLRASAPTTIDYEAHFPPNDRWAAVLACPTKTGISIFLRDISGQKRAEETVRSSVTLVHGSLDTMLDACMLCAAERDDKGAIVSFRVDFANVVAGMYLGSPPETLMGASIPEWKVTPRDMPFLDACRHVVETGDPWAVDALAYAIAGPEGTSRTGSLSLQVARFSDGFFATWRDVTEAQRLASEREVLAAIVEQSPDGILVSDASGRYVEVNPALCRMLGFSREEVLGMHVGDLAADDDTVGTAGTDARLVEAMDEAGILVERRFRRGDGTSLPVEVRFKVLPDGRKLRNVRDISERISATEALRQSEAQFREAFEFASIGMALVGLDGRWLKVNKALVELLGYSEEELLAGSFQDITHPDDLAADLANVQAMLAGSISTYRMNKRYIRRDGHVLHAVLSVSLTRGTEDEPRHFVSQITDRSAEHDLALEEQVRGLLAEGLHHVTAGASLDDAAKRVCDLLGGLAWVDLVAVAAFLGPDDAQVVAGWARDGSPPRRGDRLSRKRAHDLQRRAVHGPWADLTGGDDPDAIKLAVDAGLAALAYSPIRQGDDVLGALIVGTRHPDFARTLVERMPGMAAFGTTASALLGERLEVLRREHELRATVSAIIAARSFHPVFQPIVDLETAELIGYEALTRFDTGQRPDLCFADAWSVGLGPALEIATLEAAVAAGKELPAGTWLDLNVSPRLLLDPGRLREILWGSDRALVLEVTEHELIGDYDALRAAVRDLGRDIRLAVDDAGAGIANFSHIIDLRPDFVKLDISLVRRVNAHLGRQAMVVGMRHFSRTAGCRLIAEGIETEEEAATLRVLGVEFGQGYLFGHPGPAAGWSRPQAGAPASTPRAAGGDRDDRA